MDPPSNPSPPPSAPCWSAVLQTKSSPKPQEPVSSKIFANCSSSNCKGISVAVVDANAIIHGDKLVGVADKFVTISEAVDEVKDPVSRQRLAFLPLTVETMEPSPDSLKKVVKFARETGDLQTLSDVDLKLIALTHMLESQIHGTSHLRERPPPLHMVNAKSLPEAQMPGWGTNVPNLAEWEALEQLSEKGLHKESRILPLTDLDDNIVLADGSVVAESRSQDGDQISGRTRKFSYPQKEIIIEGKKMVADGIDASLGDDTENAGNWRPAVSRSTHRRYLKRVARRELAKALEEDVQQVEDARRDASVNEVEDNGEEHQISYALEDMKLNTDEVKEDSISSPDIGTDHHFVGEASLHNLDISSQEADENEMNQPELENLEISSQTDVDTSTVDDASSEQSWMLRSLSDSSVACVTSDYAMQNVILQIGLRLLAPGGMQIRQLHRWVLKCHACNKLTQEIGRIFCPKCGNGGTLRKVSVTVGENGVVLAARRQRFILRGTKFSLPLPQGGRDAITKNMILREDQLPRKLLHPKTKKSNKQDQDFLCSDDIFTHCGEKKAPLKPPVRKAVALYSGKRNPNDNHFSRSKH